MIDVLELLASDGAGLTGSEMSRRLALPKSTAFLLLQHLVERGIVSLDPATRRYRIGPALVQLAFQITTSIDLVRVARPYLERLSRETTDDVYLGIRHGTRFIYVDKLEGTQSIRLNMRLGQPRPLHSTAVGKLLLAFGPPELLDQVIAERGLPRMTPATITDPGRLREELERIRQQGYSISEAENVEGVYGFAAPVRGHDGDVVAAIHISTLEARASTQREFLIERMCALARELSRDIGGTDGSGSGPSRRGH
ncbi:MAG TPA: IclR family transcriptional regulator [Thermodesulfobacteriota bacterium]